MFRVALCDDNDKILDIEEKIVSQYLTSKNIEYSVSRFRKGQELFAEGNCLEEFEIIFLDVEMDEIDGIEVARRIREQSEVPIAFVTAYITYSLEGYKVNAMRYILKKMESIREGICECLDSILLRKSREISQKMILELREGKKEILLKDLIYIESHHHYCYYHIQEQEKESIYKKREKLDEVEEQMKQNDFIRIHKSYMVNLSYIADVKRYEADLITGERLMIAQSKYLEVKKKYLIYCGIID